MKKVALILVLSVLYFLSLPGRAGAQVPGVEWNYRSPGTQQGIPQSIVIADSGKLVVAAAREGVKVFDPRGKLLKTYPMASTNIKRVLRNTDGTYYVVGDTIADALYYTDGWIAKLNDTFGIIWQRSCGGIEDDEFIDAALSGDGGIMLAGRSNSTSGDLDGVPNIFPGGWNYGWLLKLNGDGLTQWTKIYGYQPDSINVPGASHAIDRIVALKEGGYIFGGQIANGTGEAGPVHGSRDGWVVRIDDTGGIIWQKTFGGNILMALTGGALTKEGDFIATGIGKSLNGIPNSTVQGNFFGIVAQKFKGSNGDVLWTRAIGTGAAYQEEPCTLWYGDHTAVTTDGNLVMSAYLTMPLANMNVPAMNQQFKGKNDFWVLKLSAADGSLLWHKVFGGNNIDRAYTLTPTPDGGLIVGGNSNSGSDDVNTPSPLPMGYTPWLAKLGPCPYTFSASDTICNGRSFSFYGNNYDSTGVYVKNFKVENGCDSTYTLHLFVSGKKPALTVDSNVLSTGTFNAYQWLKEDTLIAGATAQNYTITDRGTYRVVVTNERGCTDTSDAYVYSPEIPSPQDGFRLYPVPANHELYIEWVKMASGADIVVLGIDGKILLNAYTTDTFVALPVNDLARGIYLLKVIVAGEKVIRKFVKL